MQGGSAHARIFSWACWSGVWPRSNARRLAVPKGPTVKNVFLHISTPRERLGDVQHGSVMEISARVFLEGSRDFFKKSLF